MLGGLPTLYNLSLLFVSDQRDNALATGLGYAILCTPGLVTSAVAVALTGPQKRRGRALAVAGVLVGLATFFAGILTAAACFAKVGHELVR